jgi:ABC-type branched-subunit amino acid transport system substrate-binding protein
VIVSTGRLWPLVVGVSLLGGGCRQRQSVALIDLAAGEAKLRPVIDVVLDSLNRAASLAVRLVPPPKPGGRAEPVLIAEVYHALEAARVPEVVGVAGLAGSSDVMTVGPVYRDAGIPVVVPTANAPQLSHLGTGVFLMGPTLDEEAGFISNFVAGRLGASAVTILYNPGAWGAALQAALARELWQHGLRVLGPLPVPTIRCGADVRALSRYVAAALRLGRPDAVVLATYEDCLVDEFERQAPGLTFVVGDGLVVRSDYVRSRPRVARRLFAVRFLDPSADSGSAAFRRLFESVNGSPPTWDDAATFDAVMLIATATREVGANRAAVWRYLYQLGRTRPPFAGITGPIAFTGAPVHRLSMDSFAAPGVPQ